ncbi:MAG: IS256 family transposase, partial [Proteobacteria bacterium]|nr:IS256 family transposase [Pseudomonadota bacterium]
KDSMRTSTPIKSLLTETLNLIAEAEFEAQIGVKPYERSNDRKGYRLGHRERRFDTTCGTIKINVPRLRKGTFTPSFMSRYSRYEPTLLDTITTAYIAGVSTSKMDSLVRAMGVEGISKGQVSNITAHLNDLVKTYQSSSLADKKYPVIYIDAIWTDIKVHSKKTLTAVAVVVGMNEKHERELITVDVIHEETTASYLRLLNSLKQRGLNEPKLLVADGASGLIAAMREVYPNTKRQRCKVHAVRKISKNIKHVDRKVICQRLKEIWYTSNKEKSRKIADKLEKDYGKQYPKSMTQLRKGLEDTLTYVDFPEYSPRKIASTNVIERLNRELNRRSKSIGVFPNEASCLKLFTVIAIEHSKNWNHEVILRKLKKRSMKFSCDNLEDLMEQYPEYAEVAYRVPSLNTRENHFSTKLFTLSAWPPTHITQILL